MCHVDTKEFGRREFLRVLGGIAASPLIGPISQTAFAAGPFSDYRALVCVFLNGGNDAHNMIVPLDSRYAVYATNRGPLALPQTALQGNAITDPTQGAFGFHPRMKQAAALFNTGKLAVVSNVGVLLRPTTKFDFQNNRGLPPQLFSHGDMVEAWHTCRPGDILKEGWGGRLADLLQSGTGQELISISTSNSKFFFKGASSSAYNINTYTGSSRAIIQPVRAWSGGWVANGLTPQIVYENIIGMARSNVFEQQYSELAQRAVDYNDFVLDALYVGQDGSGNYMERAPLKAVFPAGNRLAAQLRSVAMMIAARQALGAKRQLFFVIADGTFDTHSDQFDAANSELKPGPNDLPILFGTHADRLSQVDAALKAFYDATIELGVQNSVTTFTASDFGRTLTANGKGADHGWGAHHLVLGGAVKGGTIYGTFHNMQIGSGNPVDAGQGRLIPDFSVDQYAATLCRWMGASAADLNVVFPNLANFPQTDLGFMT